MPVWVMYMMLAASLIGSFFLMKDLANQGWPKPFGG